MFEHSNRVFSAIFNVDGVYVSDFKFRIYFNYITI